jgi:hypothetical protein
MKVDPEDLRRRGLWTRLDSHASGRRSGDQFCIYVCDRLVIPTLAPEQIQAVGAGTLSLDAMTKQYIRGLLSYRFVATTDSTSAFRLERLVQGGELDAGSPILIRDSASARRTGSRQALQQVEAAGRRSDIVGAWVVRRW